VIDAVKFIEGFLSCLPQHDSPLIGRTTSLWTYLRGRTCVITALTRQVKRGIQWQSPQRSSFSPLRRYWQGRAEV